MENILHLRIDPARGLLGARRRRRADFRVYGKSGGCCSDIRQFGLIYLLVCGRLKLRDT